MADQAKTGKWRPNPANDRTADEDRTDEKREFYSRAEVVEMTPKSMRTIRRYIAEGTLLETPLGIPASEIEQLKKGTVNGR